MPDKKIDIKRTIIFVRRLKDYYNTKSSKMQ